MNLYPLTHSRPVERQRPHDGRTRSPTQTRHEPRARKKSHTGAGRLVGSTRRGTPSWNPMWRTRWGADGARERYTLTSQMLFPTRFAKREVVDISWRLIGMFLPLEIRGKVEAGGTPRVGQFSTRSAGPAQEQSLKRGANRRARLQDIATKTWNPGKENEAGLTRLSRLTDRPKGAHMGSAWPLTPSPTFRLRIKGWGTYGENVVGDDGGGGGGGRAEVLTFVRPGKCVQAG